MNRLLRLIGRDTVLLWRNYHILVVAVVALIMVALIVFLPNELASAPGEYLLDTIDGSPVRRELIEMGGRADGLPQTQEEFDRLLHENPNAIGVVVEGTIDRPQVRVVEQASVADRNLNILIATIETVFRRLHGDDGRDHPVEMLRAASEPIPLNLSGVPVFLAFEVAILGFLLVAVLIFQEKQEGTIRAYRVSPGGLAPYLASKTLVFTALGLVYGAVIVLVGFGFRANWAAVLVLVGLSGAFMTVFGLGFAAWFDNLSDWFFPGLAVLMLNMLPFVSYIYPPFSPAWIAFVPSYGLLFALREALFPTGDSELIRSAVITGSGWLVGAIAFAAVSVRSRLLKGA